MFTLKVTKAHETVCCRKYYNQRKSIPCSLQHTDVPQTHRGNGISRERENGNLQI